MGWRLVEEVLEGCPDLRYRPFRILVALAADARDTTRQAMPGHEKLALRGNCNLRTVRRAMSALESRGLVKKISHSGPGRRAVYEILPITGTPDNSVSAEHRTPTDQHRTPHGDRRSPDNSVSPPSSKDSHRSPSSPRTAAGIIRDAIPSITDAEIETIIHKISQRNPRSIVAYIKTLAGNGDLAKYRACDEDGTEPHSNACRNGDGNNCTAGWCKCQCHRGWWSQ